MSTFFRSFYQGLIAIGSHLQSLVLLGIRLYWGLGFFYSGLGKLAHIDHVISFFKELGIPFPLFNSYAAALVECGCGILLIIGLATRLAAIPLMVVMVIAYVTAHFDAVKNIFVDFDNFVAQSPFNFLFASLLLFVFGPGRISLDGLLKRFYFKGSSL